MLEEYEADEREDLDVEGEDNLGAGGAGHAGEEERMAEDERSEGEHELTLEQGWMQEEDDANEGEDVDWEPGAKDRDSN